MEFRKIFDTIPDAQIGPGKDVLEIGPGTGQATDPILSTGCNYNAIELGEHLAAKMREKYGAHDNFHLVCDDFITHDFSEQKFDVIYSAATIQWIPEEIAFAKTFDLLKPGGTLFMLLMRGEFRSANPVLYEKIQQVYAKYFKPEVEYTHGGFCYANATNYGYVDFQEKDFLGTREYTAKEYAAFCGTHCDHLALKEPYKSQFFQGLEQVIRDEGDKVVCKDTYVMMSARKPMR